MTTLAKASEYSELDRKLTSPSYHNLECDDFHRNWRVFLQGVRAKKKVMENILAVQRSASRRGEKFQRATHANRRHRTITAREPTYVA
jgi:hypothetical protein